jgi:hypothetical protein
MAKPRYDVVVEAVRYKEDGEVEWVRGYERRGPTFSDHVLIRREAVVDRLKSGQTFVTGRRIAQLAGTFDVQNEMRLTQTNGKEIITTGGGDGARDHLEGVPIL